MARRYNLFLGGNKRHYGMMDVAWESELTPPDQHVEYAEHLKPRHFVVPFHYDHYSENFQMWYREHQMRDLDVGDEITTHLLAAGTHIRSFVFNAKKSVPGTILEIEFYGVASDSPVDYDTLQDAVEKARAKVGEAQVAVYADPDNATKKQALADAKAAFAQAEKALMDASTSSIAKYEVDMEQDGLHHFEVNKFIQANGLVVTRLKKGTMMNTCWSSMVEVVHFNDQHGCTCGIEPCDTEFPNAECQPTQFGTRLK